MKYQSLYESWRNHDLRYTMPSFERHPLWKNLRASDEERVWLFIEENYLDKYSMFIRIDPEWSSSGIWDIYFPGATGTGPCLIDNYLDLPKVVCDKVQAWVDYYDNYARPWKNENDPMDYDLLNMWGLNVAKIVKRFAPSNYYVEYHYFRELVISGNEVIEKEIPEFVRNLAGLIISE